MSAFAGEPQPVEIHHRGIWYSGELLGWTNSDDGRVLARVRCVVDGLRHSTWKDLAELRLPDPSRPPRREVFPAPPARATTAVPAVPEEDATRPHALLAGLRVRPSKPEHALAPPPPRDRMPAVPLHRPAAKRRHPDRRRRDELSAV